MWIGIVVAVVGVLCGMGLLALGLVALMVGRLAEFNDQWASGGWASDGDASEV